MSDVLLSPRRPERKALGRSETNLPGALTIAQQAAGTHPFGDLPL